MMNIRLLCSVALLVALGNARGAEDYLRDIRPILKARCFRCHDSRKSKGNLNLQHYEQSSQVVADLKKWRTVAEVVAAKQMPPPGHPPLQEKQREQIARWVAGVVHQAEHAVPTDPGPSLPRRITRREYRNMVRDLFNVSVDVETYLPEGRSATGYDNQVAQLSLTPELLEKYLLLVEQTLEKAFPPIESTRQKEPIKSWCIGWAGEKGLTARAAAEVDLAHLARLAYRRPIEANERATLLRLFDQAYGKNKNFPESLRFAVKGMLVSPQFLFRTEAIPADDRPVRIDDFELASRLSFFLWSSLPDNELLTLAGKGVLHRPEILRKQVRRMMRDPKVRGLTGDFPPQWLFGRLSTHRLDQILFPDYTPGLIKAGADELALYFEKLLQEKGSLIDLLDSDYAYVNEDLAGVYGFKKITGPLLQKVKLTDRQRGGLLGMAVVLQKTSMPNRTSPTIRGKWVLDSLLGAPPPPPPPNLDVSGLDSKKPDAGGKILTFRDKLALHAEQGSACVNCHRKMDPLGFSLENFDPLGRYRDKDNGRPVDNTGKMPDGKTLRGVESVKKVLLDNKDAFARNLADHLLTYALGRDLESYDLTTARQVAERVKKSNFRADVLIEEIVMSYPFQYKRAPNRCKAPTPPGRKKS